MFTKAQVLARLNARHAQIAASEPNHKARQTIQHTLDALDSQYSYYVVLSDQEKALIRSDWLALAVQMGMWIKQRKTRSQTSKMASELPQRVATFFGRTDSLPIRPRATDDYKQGVQRMSWKSAQSKRSIELNPPAHIYWLLFDCDHSEYERWKNAGLPEPAFITINPSNGHHHVAYRLKMPVCRSEHARIRPLAYLRAVQEAMRLVLDGDPHYAGVLTKNPLHPAWVTIHPLQIPEYTLAQLAAAVNLQATKSSPGGRRHRHANTEVSLTDVGVGGRNRALFDAVRLRPRSDIDIQDYADSCNALLQQPLTSSEVTGIVKSIERYESCRTDRKAAKAFRLRQSARGSRGGRPLTTGQSQPWVAAGVSRSTWYRRQKVIMPTADQAHAKMQRTGRPITTKNSQPWIALGISRATWYRNQRNPSERDSRA